MSLYSLLLIKSINLAVLLFGIFPFFHSNPKSLVISGLTGISTKSLGFTARDEYRNAPQFPLQNLKLYQADSSAIVPQV